VFSTPSCTACRTAQHPAVEAVEARFGEALRILKKEGKVDKTVIDRILDANARALYGLN